MGTYQYTHGNVTFKGSFNIFQTKNGAVMLVMGNNAAILTYDQISALNIDCYLLNDFDYDLFEKYYNLQNIEP